MNRRKSREVAMKLLFESFIQKEHYVKIIENLKENIEIESENIDESIKHEKDIETIDLVDVDMTYVTNILKGINESLESIDKEIEKYLVNWKLNRISKVDLAILRIATYEILFDEEIPDKVSVNEAIELAKKYSEEKSAAFINGILNNMIKK